MSKEAEDNARIAKIKLEEKERLEKEKKLATAKRQEAAIKSEAGPLIEAINAGKYGDIIGIYKAINAKNLPDARLLQQVNQAIVDNKGEPDFQKALIEAMDKDKEMGQRLFEGWVNASRKGVKGLEMLERGAIGWHVKMLTSISETNLPDEQLLQIMLQDKAIADNERVSHFWTNIKQAISSAKPEIKENIRKGLEKAKKEEFLYVGGADLSELFGPVYKTEVVRKHGSSLLNDSISSAGGLSPSGTPTSPVSQKGKGK